MRQITTDLLDTPVPEALRQLGACEEAIAWSHQFADPGEAWDACTNVSWMLWILEQLHVPGWDDRTTRRFTCWCVRETPLGDGRKVWDLLTDDRTRFAVEVSESFADGAATAADLLAAARDAARAATAAKDAAVAAAWAATAARAAAAAAAKDAAAAAAAAGAAARAAQCRRLREVVGNPFRVVARDTERWANRHKSKRK